MDAEPIPRFAEAVQRYRVFLAKQNESTDIIWVFRDDVLRLGKRFYVRPPREDQRPLIESLYDFCASLGYGVELTTVCFLGGQPCCSVFAPADALEASQMMLTEGLRLSVLCDFSRAFSIARLVKSPLYWRWLKWRQTSGDRMHFGHIPQRAQVTLPAAPT